MEGNKRIAVNTIASYSRTILGALLALLSNRWLLQEMGVSDYGLFTLVGTLLYISGFFNTLLANSDARFIGIEIGKGEKGEIGVVLKAEIILHLITALIVVFVGYFIAEYVMSNYLNIAAERIGAAITVLRFSFIVSFFAFASVPFSSLFVAHQDIFLSSILTLVQSVLLFFSAFTLKFVDSDKLITYSVFYTMSMVVVYLSFVLFAFYRYNCCKQCIRERFNWLKAKSILKYSFWNFFGEFGHLLRGQGLPIVTNLLFGTAGNAALGIANQIALQSSNITNAMVNAISPEITRRVGANETGNIINIASIVSRISVLFTFVISIPVILSIDSILSIWLVEVPYMTATICIYFISMYVVEKMVVGEWMVMKAFGHMALMQVLIFIGYGSSVLWPFLGLEKEFGIACIGIAGLLSMLLSRLGIYYATSRKFKLDHRKTIFRTILPGCLILFIVVYLRQFVDNGDLSILQIAIYSILSLIIALPIYILLTFTYDERSYLISKITKRKYTI